MIFFVLFLLRLSFLHCFALHKIDAKGVLVLHLVRKKYPVKSFYKNIRISLTSDQNTYINGAVIVAVKRKHSR